MKKITIYELKDLLIELGNKVPFIGMDVETTPRVRKNAQGLIKTCKVSGRAGAHVKEPLGDRSWGIRLESTPIVAHKGNFYLEIDVTSVKDEVYHCTELDINISLEDAVERGYRDRPLVEGINLRDYKLESIKRIRINKNEYEISADKSLV